MSLNSNFFRIYFLPLLVAIFFGVHVTVNSVNNGSITTIFDEFSMFRFDRTLKLILIDYSDIEYSPVWPTDLLHDQNRLIKNPNLSDLKRLNGDIRHRKWVNSATKDRVGNIIPIIRQKRHDELILNPQRLITRASSDIHLYQINYNSFDKKLVPVLLRKATDSR